MKRLILSYGFAVLAVGLFATGLLTAPDLAQLSPHDHLAAPVNITALLGDGGALAALAFGGLVVNAANMSRVTTGFRTTFNQAFSGAPTTQERVAMQVPSSTKIEEYGWLGAVPAFREWLGDRVVQNLATSSYQIKNKKFELTIGIGVPELEDDQYGIYNPMISEMGRAAKQHPDQLVWSLLKDGWSLPCYDSQNFFDTDHPVLDATGAPVSQSNSGGGAGAPWFLLDTTRMVKPLIFQKRKDYKFVAMDQASDEAVFTKDEFRYGVDARVNAGFGLWQLAYGSKQTLDHAAYAAARAVMVGRTGDHGRVLGIVPNLLVCGPSLEANARQVLMNERKANGEDNEWKGTAEVLMVPWLA